MAMTDVILAICVAIGFGAAWLWMRVRLSKGTVKLRATQHPSTPFIEAEMPGLLQSILDVTSRMDCDVDCLTQQLTDSIEKIRLTFGHQASELEAPILQLLEANVTLRDRLHSARRELSSKKSELEAFVNEARTDLLTGLKNRRSFDEELHRSFAQRQRQGIVFSLILVDIDNFKKINDSYGHLSGDHVLQSVARTLTVTTRDMDFVCRYGGDEFAVICSGSQLHEAAVAAERIRQAVADEMQPLKDAVVQVTISLGVAEVGPSEIADGLLLRADEALYSAKHCGRNRVHLHNGQECSPIGDR